MADQQKIPDLPSKLPSLARVEEIYAKYMQEIYARGEVGFIPMKRGEKRIKDMMLRACGDRTLETDSC